MDLTHRGKTDHRRWLHWLILLLIGLLAFELRYDFIAHASIQQPVGDAIQYVDYAFNLARHGVFSHAPPSGLVPVSDSYRDPGYPVFLAAWMKISRNYGQWYAAVQFSQAILGTLTVVFLLCVARRWLRWPWLAAGGVLMAIWPHSVAISGYLLTETLLGFLCAIALLLFHLAAEQNKRSLAAASGVAFSMAAMTNAVMLPFAPLLALYLWMRQKASRRIVIALALATLLASTPWIMRTATLPAVNSSSSNRALLNLVQGSWPSYHEAWRRSLAADSKAIDILKHMNDEAVIVQQHHSAGLRLMLARMGREPLTYLRWYLGKPALMWGWNIRIGYGDIYPYPTRNATFQDQPAYRAIEALCHAINPWLLAAAAIGALLALWKGRSAPEGAQAMALLLIFVTFIYSVLQAEPRYSIPFRGEEILLAMLALQQGIRHLQPMHKSRVSATATVP